MAEETVVIEAPITPETSFEDYVAQRTEASAAQVFAAEVEEVAEAPNPPETPVESAPAEIIKEATPETPAATVIPSEPATAPAIVEETQEQKEQREKNKGIPQSRLDEVTKARREAERALESEKTAREKAERELAEIKAKPVEIKPPVVEPEKSKPIAPDPPTLEGDASGDWDKFQKLTAEYNKVKYPAYVEELSDWKADQRDIAIKEKAEADTAAKRTEADNKAKAEVEKVTEEAAKTWNSQVQTVIEEHPDYNEKTSKVPASNAMLKAISVAFENGPDFAYWLADRPEEAKRIAGLTGLGKQLIGNDFEKAVATAIREFDKLGYGTTPIEPETPVTPEVPAAVAPVPVVPPVNPKPASTKAPRPPSPVNDRGNPGPQDPKAAQTMEEYEAARLPQLKRATRR